LLWSAGIIYVSTFQYWLCYIILALLLPVVVEKVAVFVGEEAGVFVDIALVVENYLFCRQLCEEEVVLVLPPPPLPFPLRLPPQARVQELVQVLEEQGLVLILVFEGLVLVFVLLLVSFLIQ
jgi:hypothetical protein